MNITMIGLGKLGLPVAESMSAEHTVTGYDINLDIASDKIDIRRNLAVAVEQAEIIFIAVPTPHDKMYGGESSFLPLKINSAGVIPAIFASALLLLPVTFSNFNVSQNETFLNISSYFTQGQPLYMLLYASGIIFFTFFYTSITFNPNETADNLRKYGGFIPGIRPGESTAVYIENILTKLTTIGALYLTLVCLMPEFLIAKYPIPFYLGGTSILIVVVVAIDTVTQIQTRLMSSQYEQLIKKTKFGK